MSKFIMLKNYYQFKNYENILMSLIVGLKTSNKTICFSNKYAALKCGVSIPTITRTISKFVEGGYITCYFTHAGRIIHLLKEPILEEEFEDCEMNITPNHTDDTPNHTDDTPNHTDDTPNHTDDTPSSQGLDPLITVITNNIDYNIDYNIDNNIDYKIDDNIPKKLTSIDFKTKEEYKKQFISDGMSEEDAEEFAISTVKLNYDYDTSSSR